jgi:hypothetical protein
MMLFFKDFSVRNFSKQHSIHTYMSIHSHIHTYIYTYKYIVIYLLGSKSEVYQIKVRGEDSSQFTMTNPLMNKAIERNDSAMLI